jgi:hypothetical protein
MLVLPWGCCLLFLLQKYEKQSSGVFFLAEKQSSGVFLGEKKKETDGVPSVSSLCR